MNAAELKSQPTAGRYLL